MKSMAELRATGERFLRLVHHDPEALVGAILEHFEVVEKDIAELRTRLDDVMEANDLWSGR